MRFFETRTGVCAKSVRGAGSWARGGGDRDESDRTDCLRFLLGAERPPDPNGHHGPTLGRPGLSTLWETLGFTSSRLA